MERIDLKAFINDGASRPPSRGSSGSSSQSAFVPSSPSTPKDWEIVLLRSTNIGPVYPAKNEHPQWLSSLLNAPFFTPCCKHPDEKKNECTFFCVSESCTENMTAMCQHCLPEHPGSDRCALLQIRRYVYCNVVRSADIQRYIDISGIQNYIVNSTKVVFLESRPQSKTFKPNSTERCRTCRRYLREGCRYCSLHCKVFEDSPNMWSQEERSSATCVSCNSSVQEDGPLADSHTPPPVSRRKRSLQLCSGTTGSTSSYNHFDLQHLMPAKRRKQAYPRRSPSE